MRHSTPIRDSRAPTSKSPDPKHAAPTIRRSSTDCQIRTGCARALYRPAPSPSAPRQPSTSPMKAFVRRPFVPHPCRRQGRHVKPSRRSVVLQSGLTSIESTFDVRQLPSQDRKSLNMWWAPPARGLAETLASDLHDADARVEAEALYAPLLGEFGGDQVAPPHLPLRVPLSVVGAREPGRRRPPVELELGAGPKIVYMRTEFAREDR